MPVLGTKEMCKAEYWYSKPDDPDKVLVSPSKIREINKRILEKETGVTDLRCVETVINGLELNEALVKAAREDDIPFYLEQAEALYNADGQILKTESFEEAVRNIPNPDAKVEQAVRYGIVVTVTSFRGLPSDMIILEEKGDFNFDYLYTSSLKVNDPLVILSVSADGKYYYAKGVCASGWVPAAEVAVCSDRDQWLEAWDFGEEDSLIIYDSKVMTEITRVSPEVSGRVLTMGTVLRLVNEAECPDTITGRAPFFNHVVWLPVRNEDGSYSRSAALIPFHAKASEGYLPLTYRTLAEVAFNKLGDTYGWGGMLSSNDCSGYIRDIYNCFGLRLAGNTYYQSLMPVKTVEVDGKSAKEKEEILDTLPMGTMLLWSGHVVLYLGEDSGEYYVINSISSSKRPDGKGKKIRNVIINSLNMETAIGNKWLDLVTHMIVPFSI